MEIFYKLVPNGFIKTDASKSDLTIFRNLTDDDESNFLFKYELPQDVFYFDQIKPVAPRYEKVQNKQLGETRILVLSNIVPSRVTSNVEDRLESHVLILGEEHLYWFIKDSLSRFDTQLMETYNEEINNLYSMIMYKV